MEVRRLSLRAVIVNVLTCHMQVEEFAEDYTVTGLLPLAAQRGFVVRASGGAEPGALRMRSWNCSSTAM